MNDFEYATPAGLEEAVDLLTDEWGPSEIMAGGTDLVTCLKQRVTSPDRVVSLRGLWELKGIRAEADHLEIGALTRLGELIDHPVIRSEFPGIVTAIQGVGSPQILSTGTLGGDLCQRPRCWYFRSGHNLLGDDPVNSRVRTGDNRYHAVFATQGPALFVNPSSLGPILIALDATLVAAGPGGESREIACADFFKVPGDRTQRETALRPNEILTIIRIPRRKLRNAVYEVRHRRGFDWPYVTAAVAFEAGGGATGSPRVLLGHVAAIPWRAKHAEALLSNARIDENLATHCGEAAISEAQPLSRNGYKLPLIKAAVRRAVLAAAF